MKRFIGENIGRELKNYCESDTTPLYVLSPFISTDTAERIVGSEQRRATTIVTTWRFEYLVRGVSSVDLFPLCQREGWSLYLNDPLHAKVYSAGLRSAWIGSANLTERAMGTADRANIEVLYLVDPMPRDMRRWTLRTVAQARLVTEELHDWYAERLSEVRAASHKKPSYEEPEVPSYIHSPFLISQLPASRSPESLWTVLNSEDPPWDDLMAAEHDLALYGVDPMIQGYPEFSRSLARAFFGHPFIEAFDNTIDADGMRFGAVKEWVQKNCTDVPIPFRRLLTPHVQCLYSWMVGLGPHQYEVIQPNVSQIIRRVDD